VTKFAVNVWVFVCFMMIFPFESGYFIGDL